MKKISLIPIVIFGLLCVTMTLPAFSAGVELNAVTNSTVPNAGNTTKAMSSPSKESATSFNSAGTVDEAQNVSWEWLTEGGRSLKINDWEFQPLGKTLKGTDLDNGTITIMESVSLDEYALYYPDSKETGLIPSEEFSSIGDYYPELTGDSVISALSEAGFIAETEIGGESVWQIQDSFRELGASGALDLVLNMDDPEEEAEVEEYIYSVLKRDDVTYISYIKELLPEGAEEKYGFLAMVEVRVSYEDVPGVELVVKYDIEPGSTEIKTSRELHYSPDYQGTETITYSNGEQGAITTTITPESFEKAGVEIQVGKDDPKTIISVPFDADFVSEEEFEITSADFPEGVEFVNTYDSGSYQKYTIDSDGKENLTEMGYLKGATIEKDGVTYTFDEEVKTVKLKVNSKGLFLEREFDKEVSLTGDDGTTGTFTKKGAFFFYQES